jgi:integrase
MDDFYKITFDKRRQTFYVNWTENGGRKCKSLKTADPKKAQVRFAEFILNTANGDTIQKSKIQYTIDDFWRKYLESHLNQHSVRPDLINSMYLRNIKPIFGKLTLKELTWSLIDNYIRSELQSGKSTGTVRKQVSLLRACLNWCANPIRGIIKEGDMPVITLPKASPPRDRVLTKDQVMMLIKEAEKQRVDGRLSRLERFIYLAYYTGARCRSIETLMWDQVDFKTNRIHYAKAGAIRTQKRCPTVPMCGDLRDVLMQAYSERTSPYVLDNDHAAYFYVKKLGEQCGVDNISPHTFRHSIATNLARSGTSSKAIAELLGNSESVVMRTYAKHMTNDLEKALKAYA